MAITVGATPRTQGRRVPRKTVTDSQAVFNILDAGVYATVAFVVDGQPYAVPVAYARQGARVVFHGSSASRLFTTLAEGHPVCFTVTLLDGLVAARSAFNSSMNYRSVMVLGACSVLDGEEKQQALLDLTEHLLPGRTAEARPTSAKEDKATMMLALELEECSCKISAKYPEDNDEDLADPIYGEVWAGIIPIREVFGTPIPDAQTLFKRIPLPDYMTPKADRFAAPAGL
jgi:nitroimidazol reductase NimA-like FMN-containing flavoprotein (pyridoxamine 5'-phosphate oxidase superfamily)